MELSVGDEAILYLNSIANVQHIPLPRRCCQVMKAKGLKCRIYRDIDLRARCVTENG